VRDPYARSVVVGLILFAAAFTGLEMRWRQYGHRPSVVDDPAWWACQRARVYDADGRTVVLVGQSRMHLDFSTDTFRRRFPRYRIVQLAVNGRNPVATLRDLAEDEDFHGIVLYEADILSLRLDKPQGQRWQQDEYVDYYHRKLTLNKQIDRTISAWMQAHFVTLNPSLSATAVIRHLWNGEGLPEPYFLMNRYDRSGCADFSHFDIRIQTPKLTEAIWLNYRGFRKQARADWFKDLEQIDGFVKKIQARGGNVVFIHLPITGASVAANDTYFPRSLYWEPFAAGTSGLTLHCADFPALSQFDCPDTSHLDQRDAPAFTNALLDELVRLGALPKE
jgi:hypothetical protein